MAKYTLYEAIKDKLSPNTQRKLEKAIQYNEFIKEQTKKKEDF